MEKTSSFCFERLKRERKRENICLHFRVSIVGGVEHLAHTTTNLSVIFVQFYWQHSCFEIKKMNGHSSKNTDCVTIPSFDITVSSEKVFELLGFENIVKLLPDRDTQLSILANQVSKLKFHNLSRSCFS